MRSLRSHLCLVRAFLPEFVRLLCDRHVQFVTGRSEAFGNHPGTVRVQPQRLGAVGNRSVDALLVVLALVVNLQPTRQVNVNFWQSYSLGSKISRIIYRGSWVTNKDNQSINCLYLYLSQSKHTRILH